MKIALRISFGNWWLASKIIKLVELFKRNIRDICFLPASIFFGYFYTFIKLYAAFTLYKVFLSNQMRSRINSIYRQAGVVDRTQSKANEKYTVVVNEKGLYVLVLLLFCSRGSTPKQLIANKFRSAAQPRKEPLPADNSGKEARSEGRV